MSKSFESKLFSAKLCARWTDGRTNSKDALLLSKMVQYQSLNMPQRRAADCSSKFAVAANQTDSAPEYFTGFYFDCVLEMYRQRQPSFRLLAQSEKWFLN
jgi:hypothetical protein